ARGPVTHVAGLSKSRRPIASRPNRIDAAIGELTPELLKHQPAFYQEYLPQRNLAAFSGTATAQLGEEVFKVGRTTGYTEGKVSSISVRMRINSENGHAFRFIDSLGIESTNTNRPFSKPGDSGALIVSLETRKAVGLLYSGNSLSTFACPIEAVL